MKVQGGFGPESYSFDKSFAKGRGRSYRQSRATSCASVSICGDLQVEERPPRGHWLDRVQSKQCGTNFTCLHDDRTFCSGSLGSYGNTYMNFTLRVGGLQLASAARRPGPAAQHSAALGGWVRASGSAPESFRWKCRLWSKQALVIGELMFFGDS